MLPVKANGPITMVTFISDTLEAKRITLGGQYLRIPIKWKIDPFLTPYFPLQTIGSCDIEPKGKTEHLRIENKKKPTFPFWESGPENIDFFPKVVGSQ